MARHKIKLDQIRLAIEEANRFIERAEDWEFKLKANPDAVSASKEGGACKRASMDLTRALVDVRKPAL